MWFFDGHERDFMVIEMNEEKIKKFYFVRYFSGLHIFKLVSFFHVTYHLMILLLLL